MVEQAAESKVFHVEHLLIAKEAKLFKTAKLRTGGKLKHNAFIINALRFRKTGGSIKLWIREGIGSSIKLGRHKEKKKKTDESSSGNAILN